jgi:hypothetical protein
MFSQYNHDLIIFLLKYVRDSILSRTKKNIKEIIPFYLRTFFQSITYQNIKNKYIPTQILLIFISCLYLFGLYCHDFILNSPSCVKIY